jgi:D-alanyl-D-alanine carboxypeptidase
LILVACGGSDPDPETLTDKVTTTPVEFDYQKLIEEDISEAVPGIVLLVDSPEKTFLGSSGLANVEEQPTMETYHVMPNGSAGKKLTALLTVMLDEEGLLSLDETIENSDEVTLR